MSTFLQVLLWLFGSYYVLSYVVFVVAMYIYKVCGVQSPWRYWKLVIIPFLGFWIFILICLGDVQRFLEGLESSNRHRKDVEE